MTMMTTTTLEGWDARISQVPSLVKGPLFCPVFARIPGPLVLPGSVVFDQELTLGQEPRRFGVSRSADRASQMLKFGCFLQAACCKD